LTIFLELMLLSSIQFAWKLKLLCNELSASRPGDNTRGSLAPDEQSRA
jgi:hypothetical protein